MADPAARDLAALRTSMRDYADRAMQLRRDAIAAQRAGRLIACAKLVEAARMLDQAAAAERIDREPRSR